MCITKKSVNTRRQLIVIENTLLLVGANRFLRQLSTDIGIFLKFHYVGMIYLTISCHLPEGELLYFYY